MFGVPIRDTKRSSLAARHCELGQPQVNILTAAGPCVSLLAYLPRERNRAWSITPANR
jgi:hypothetical protein